MTVKRVRAGLYELADGRRIARFDRLGTGWWALYDPATLTRSFWRDETVRLFTTLTDARTAALTEDDR